MVGLHPIVEDTDLHRRAGVLAANLVEPDGVQVPKCRTYLVGIPRHDRASCPLLEASWRGAVQHPVFEAITILAISAFSSGDCGADQVVTAAAPRPHHGGQRSRPISRAQSARDARSLPPGEASG